MDKDGESIRVLKECPLDKNGAWSKRAATKLVRLWREGHFPDKTEWAS
jgi:hypothetical protein